MIRIEGRFAAYGEVWFDEEVSRNPEVDILMLRNRPAPLAPYPCRPFHTLVSDLTVDEQSMFAAFGNTNRYKIKRADTKDQLSHAPIADPRAHVQAFCDFYDAFAEQRSIPPAYRRGISAACDAGRVLMSTASRDDEVLVWHAYMAGEEKVMLLHTASLFRTHDNDRRALIARANRWLHWRDMLTYKDMGLRQFDWGGMFEDESISGNAGINNFKREFGGKPQQHYEAEIPLTLRGRLYRAAVSARARWENRASRASSV